MRHRYQSSGTVHDVEIERHGDGYRATVYGETYEVELLDEQPGALVMRLIARSDRGETIRPRTVFWAADGQVKWLSSGGCTYRLERPAERRRGAVAGAAEADAVRSPMPAQVRSLLVSQGDEVAAGQTLLLLEAMKMEIKVAAPRGGRVALVNIKQGDTVERDQVLVTLDAVLRPE